LHTLADLVGKNFADTLEVSPKAHTVGLHLDVSDFRDELVEKGVVGSQDVKVGHNVKFKV
jgi:hypothetical protein